MNVEEKAKRYDEALKNAKHYHSEMGGDICCVLEECFPELKESEDERIRKELMEHIMYCSQSIPDRAKYIAWLEKQSEQKPIFRVGDYIRNTKTGDKVLIEQLDIATKAYCYESYDGAAVIHSDFPFSQQNEWEIIGQNIAELKPAWSKEDEIGLVMLYGAVNKQQVLPKMRMIWAMLGMLNIGSNHLKIG